MGCNNLCSYCIVPYLAGRERSRPCGRILYRIQFLPVIMVERISLLGQNVIPYLDGEVNFLQLLTKLNELVNIYRLECLLLLIRRIYLMN